MFWIRYPSVKILQSAASRYSSSSKQIFQVFCSRASRQYSISGRAGADTWDGRAAEPKNQCLLLLRRWGPCEIPNLCESSREIHAWGAPTILEWTLRLDSQPQQNSIRHNKTQMQEILLPALPRPLPYTARSRHAFKVLHPRELQFDNIYDAGAWHKTQILQRAISDAGSLRHIRGLWMHLENIRAGCSSGRTPQSRGED